VSSISERGDIIGEKYGSDNCLLPFILSCVSVCLCSALLPFPEDKEASNLSNSCSDGLQSFLQGLIEEHGLLGDHYDASLKEEDEKLAISSGPVDKPEAVEKQDVSLGCEKGANDGDHVSSSQVVEELES